MKKLVYILIIMMSVVGCKGSKWTLGRKHVYKTLFGYIDTDTMKTHMWDGEDPCYIVYITESDSFTNGYQKWPAPEPTIITYNPKKNWYYKQYPVMGGHGNAVVVLDSTRIYNEILNKK